MILARVALVLAVSLVAIATPARAEDVASAGSGVVTEISAHCTPGKPRVPLFDETKPAEEVVARLEKDRPVLVVHVNAKRDGLAAPGEERLELTLDEWNELRSIVERQKLAEWKPVAAGKHRSEHGLRGFSVTGPRPNSRVWSGPVKAPEGPEELIAAIGRLARKKLAKLKLLHFPD